MTHKWPDWALWDLTPKSTTPVGSRSQTYRPSTTVCELKSWHCQKMLCEGQWYWTHESTTPVIAWFTQPDIQAKDWERCLPAIYKPCMSGGFCLVSLWSHPSGRLFDQWDLTPSPQVTTEQSLTDIITGYQKSIKPEMISSRMWNFPIFTVCIWL